MRCPHGAECGNPPELSRCELGFPGCHCGDDAVAWVMSDDEPPPLSIAFWQDHEQL